MHPNIAQQNLELPSWPYASHSQPSISPINGHNNFSTNQHNKIAGENANRPLTRSRTLSSHFNFGPKSQKNMEGERDDCECGGFMELLGCADAVLDRRIQSEQGFLFSPSPSSSSSSACGSGFSQMLHFGAADGGPHDEEELLLTASCAAAANERSRAKKLETHGGKRGAAAAIGNDTVTSTTTRRPRGGSAGTIKMRKEKLGDRISVLQQIVSPYGKTDTATVLHEAIGYIRFLHDQVQMLSSPYIHQLPLSNHNQNVEIIGGDLSSRGLCLVPISCTENVANNNIVGADLWSPAVGGSSSSSGSKH